MSFEDPSMPDPSDSRPRFCPQCRVRVPDRGLACRRCGERLLDEPYCPICEDYWMLPESALCPKHDVALEAGPPKPLSNPVDDASTSLVTVATFPEANLAEALRLRLEAEGIPTFLQGERMGGMAMFQVATGGVRLQVPARCADDARILISQTWDVPPADDDLDDAWDELAPVPGERRRLVMKGFILLFLLGPVLTALLAFLLMGY